MALAIDHSLNHWKTLTRHLRRGLRALREPLPSEVAVLEHPELADASRIPYFLLLDLIRGG
ncbi:MAG: hypothetical protein IPF94_15230 [Betaproteobacteria bacterium]|nr:hypothetical protein [Betaproteobacteria bacterium]